MTIEDVEDWNSEEESDVSAKHLEDLIVYSRDWTIETMISQIERGNIDLDPAFQRRNAWNDLKKSRLIESLVMNIPIPEIVLAEDKDRKGSFIVIDGKQRLLAIAGFFDPSKFKTWKRPVLRGLRTVRELNSKSIIDIQSDVFLDEYSRKLLNSDIRCTVITNYFDNQTLFDIFYRLNSGNVPLSSQELRQVLNRGPFADFLLQSTNKKIPLHKVLNLDGPDARLRDAEILLRYVGISHFGGKYAGNLNRFLSRTMRDGNRNWERFQPLAEKSLRELNHTTDLLLQIFPKGKVGRRWEGNRWETRFNRALFEVEVFYLSKVPQNVLMENRQPFLEGFKNLFRTDHEFETSLTVTTKSVENYHVRFSRFQDLVNSTFGLSILSVPVSS